MATITLFTKNILESGTVTITGSAVSGKPESRTWDRSGQFLWILDGTAAVTFHVDQGASPIYDVSALFIFGHNFNGLAITFEYSDDDSAWSNGVAGWTQGDSLAIAKEMSASESHRYWRSTVASKANAQASEVLITEGHNFSVKQYSPPIKGGIPNVEWIETVGGLDRSILHGDERKSRRYAFQLTSAQLVTWRACMADLDGFSKPFVLKDDEGDYWMARFVGRPVEEPPVSGITRITADFKEVLSL